MSPFSRHAIHAALAITMLATLGLVWACVVEEHRPSAAAPAPTATTAAECVKDTDCKGDRICDKGQCTSPH
jgi:hypothetical protein